MRKGRVNAKTERKIKSINSEMRPLKQNYHAYRGDTRTLKYSPGEVFDEAGFMSTSSNPGIAVGFGSEGEGGGTLFQMVLPKGKRSIHENAIEGEIVLPPGQRMRVLESSSNKTVDLGTYKRTVGKFYVIELLED